MKRTMRVLCLMLALCLVAAAPARADLQRGDEGAEVTQLQLMLFESGWLFELPDGAFGRNTEQAVKDFERYAGLPVDGIADDEMLRTLEESWKQLMMELGQFEREEDGGEGEGGFSPNGMYPAFCNHWNHTNGNSEVDYCEAHMEMRLQAQSLMDTGDPGDARKACQLWQAEIIRLYDWWIERSSEENRSAIAAAETLFLSSVESLRVAASSYYDTFQIRPSPAEEEYALETLLREHAAWLCAMTSGSMTEGGEEEC